MWPVCNLFKTVFSFLVLQKDNSFPESFGKISWNLFDIKPASSHSLCQTSHTYLEVNGFRSEKGMRPAVSSVLKKYETSCQFSVKGQVQGSGGFLTKFPLKLAENDDVGETVIWGL